MQTNDSNSVAKGPQPLLPEQNRPYSRGFSTERNGNYNNGG